MFIITRVVNDFAIIPQIFNDILFDKNIFQFHIREISTCTQWAHHIRNVYVTFYKEHPNVQCPKDVLKTF